MSALLIRVVAGYVGVHICILGYNAAWVTNPVGWTVAILITAIRYVSGRWKTNSIVNPSAQQLTAADGTENALP